MNDQDAANVRKKQLRCRKQNYLLRYDENWLLHATYDVSTRLKHVVLNF
jgi:hypothetical protein